jgi:toxin ParE1/3/4
MARTYRSARAETDLIEIWASIADDDPAAADRLLDRIEQVCVLLATHPHAGNQRDDLAPGLRFYPVGNYLIFYVPRDDGVAVARILHGARDSWQQLLD